MLELFVHIQYQRTKIKQLKHMNKKSVALHIRRDFDLLKLPHPPEANIAVPSKSGVTVSWKTSKDQVVYQRVVNTVKKQDEVPSLIKAKSDCFIIRLSHQEKEISVTLRRSSRVSKIEGVMASLRGLISDGHEVHRIYVTITEVVILPKQPVPLAQLDDRQVTPTSESPDQLPLNSPPNDKTTEFLTEELSLIQESIEVGILKAAALEAELERLGWPAEPHTDDAYCQLVEATSQLVNEGNRRRELDILLANVERECGDPFVVPMLIDLSSNGRGLGT